jgi:hypothetical protein
MGLDARRLCKKISEAYTILLLDENLDQKKIALDNWILAWLSKWWVCYALCKMHVIALYYMLYNPVHSVDTGLYACYNPLSTECMLFLCLLNACYYLGDRVSTECILQARTQER